MTDLPEHVATNRAFWAELATKYVDPGRRNGEREERTWGIFNVPEREVGMLPAALDGRDAIELGCGTGDVSAWLARRGARPGGSHNSREQLGTARRVQAAFGIEFPLLHGNAEQVPYPDASFDIAISEYGASIWCDPYAWIPEAGRPLPPRGAARFPPGPARLLRPGGELVFLAGSIFTILCGPDDETIPAGDQLLRPLFGMHRVEWPGEASVEFHLPPGKMIALLGDSGFQVEELIEVRPAADTETK